MARLAGAVEIGVGPSLRGFQAKLNAGLKRMRGGIEVPVDPSFRRANAQMAAWRRLQERRPLDLKVRVDDRDLVRFERRVTRVETVFKASAFRRALRIQVAVVGASALPALAQGALSATAALTDLGRAAALLPALLSGAGASIAAAAIGLRGLGDAFRAAGQAAQDAAQNQKDYERAARDLAKAQRDIVKAIREANREIEDQRDRLTQGQLSVEQAQINLARANERLLKGGFESMSEYRQALLDVRQAQFDLGRAYKEHNRNVQDFYDNAAKGARQTDTFRDALDRLADVTERYVDAQNKVTGATGEFVEAMRKLGPEAQNFVNQMLALKEPFQELQRDVSDGLFRGIGDSVTELANKRLPLLRRGLTRVAGGLNATFKSVIDSVGSDRNASAFEQIFDRMAGALNRATPGVESLVNAFLRLSDVGSQFLPRLAGAFNTVMERFEKFVDRTAADGSLERWIDRSLNALTALGNSFIHLFDIMDSLTEAYEKATGNVGGFATTMERGLGRLAAYLDSPRGQRALVNYLRDARRFLDRVKEAMPGILDMFQTIGDALRDFAEVIFPIFSFIGRMMDEHATSVRTLLGLYFGFRVAAPIFSGLKYLHDSWKTATSRVRDHIRAVNEAFAAERLHAENLRKELAQAQRDQAKARIDKNLTVSQNKLALDQAERQLRQEREAVRLAREEVDVHRQAYVANKRNLEVMSSPGRLREEVEALKKLNDETLAARGGEGLVFVPRTKEVEQAEELVERDRERLKAAREQAQLSHNAYLANQRNLQVMADFESLNRHINDLETRAVELERRRAELMENPPGKRRGINAVRRELKETVAELAEYRSYAARFDEERELAARRAQDSYRKWTNDVQALDEAERRLGTTVANAAATKRNALASQMDDFERRRDEAFASTSASHRAWEDAHKRMMDAEAREADANRRVTEQKRANANSLVTAQGRLSDSTKRVTELNDRLRESMRRVAGQQGISGLIQKIGGPGATLAGTLMGALKGLVGLIAGIGVGVGVMWAMNEWIKANERASRAVEDHRSNVDALNNSLEQGTGAATAATRQQNIELLREGLDPYSGDRFDATKILQEQLGLSVTQQGQLSLPTMVQQREQALAPADSRIIAAVPQLAEWVHFGDDFKKNGVDETTYGKALNGDKDAIGKVEAARKAIWQEKTGGLLPFGIAVNTGVVPDDLGAAQSQLPDHLRQLSLGAGKLREVGDASVEAGQREQQLSLAVPGSGAGLGELNDEARSVFGQLNPNWTSVREDGSIHISTDLMPRQDWIDQARDAGIDVTRRDGSNGANIRIDPDAAKRFLRPEHQLNFHKGGAVWGKGDIPAWLSNGEFVMRPEAVEHWGLDTMYAMNAAPKFGVGGMAGQSPFRKIPEPPGPFPLFPAPAPKTPSSEPPGPFPRPATSTAPQERMNVSTANQNPLLAPWTHNPWGGTPVGGDPNIPGVKPQTRLPVVRGTRRAPDAVTPPTTKDYLFGAGAQILGTLGINVSPHPALADRQNLIADAGRALLTDITGGWPGGIPGDPKYSKKPRLGNLNFGGINLLPVSKPLTPSTAKPSVGPAGSGSVPAPPVAAPPAPTHTGTGGQAGPNAPASTPGVPGPVFAPTHSGTGGAPGPTRTPGSIVPSYEELGATSVASYVPVEYTPNLSGNGVIMENAATARSAVANAPIDPNANILDYLRQLAKAHGLFEGVSTIRPHEPTSQHATGRAIDLGGGDPSWSDPSAVERFVQWYISDPERVASTRQLIFAAPSGRKYGIINGRLLSDEETIQVYGGSNPATLGGHGDHVHLALEGVPLSAVAGNASSVGVPPLGDLPPAAPAPVQGPPGSIAAGVPAIPGWNVEPQGPFGPIPFKGEDIAKAVGQAILQAIFGFFGIDISPIINLFNQITSGLGQVNLPGVNPGQVADALPPDPGPNMQEVQQLIDQAAEAKAAGNRELAESLLQAARQAESRGAAGVPTVAGGQIIDYLPASGLLPGQTSPTPSPPEVREANRQLARQMFSSYFPESEWEAFDQLVMRESGYDNWAKNPNSTAFGIGQFLDTTWRSYWGPDKGAAATSDPAVQLDLMFKYIRNRYGTPSKALEFHNANNSYRRGGLVGRFAGGAYVDFDVWDYLDKNYGEGILQAKPGEMPYLVDPIMNANGGLVRGPGGPTDDKIPAMLSNGEFVMRAAAVKHWGVERLAAMNRLQDGGVPIDPFKIGPAAALPAPQQSPGQLPLIGPAAQGQQPAPTPNPNERLIGPAAAPPALSATARAREAVQGLASLGNSILAPKYASSASPRQEQGEASDPRAALMAPPSSENHLNPAFRAWIEGAWNTVGQVAGSAVGAAVTAGIAAGSQGGAGPAAGAAGQAAATLTAAGMQMAGQVASGWANVLSSLLVGTITPAAAGQGYGQPVLASRQQAQPTYQNIHNGNIVAYNPDEALRIKERREAQAAAPFYNRTF